MSKYGMNKEPYHYPAWVREHKDPPEHIQRELEQARKRVPKWEPTEEETAFLDLYR
jgi:hypothetical protein